MSEKSPERVCNGGNHFGRYRWDILPWGSEEWKVEGRAEVTGGSGITVDYMTRRMGTQVERFHTPGEP